jgi:hypothetical protein
MEFTKLRFIIYKFSFVWLIIVGAEEEKNKSKEESRFFISKDSLKWHDAKKVKVFVNINKKNK